MATVSVKSFMHSHSHFLAWVPAFFKYSDLLLFVVLWSMTLPCSPYGEKGLTVSCDLIGLLGQ